MPLLHGHATPNHGQTDKVGWGGVGDRNWHQINLIKEKIGKLFNKAKWHPFLPDAKIFDSFALQVRKISLVKNLAQSSDGADKNGPRSEDELGPNKFRRVQIPPPPPPPQYHVLRALHQGCCWALGPSLQGGTSTGPTACWRSANPLAGDKSSRIGGEGGGGLRYSAGGHRPSPFLPSS